MGHWNGICFFISECAAPGPDLTAQSCHLVEQPRAGVGPVALGCAVGDTQQVGRLLKGEAGEIFLFHELGLARVVGGEAIERLVDEKQLLVVPERRGDVEAGVTGADLRELATMADGALAAGIVNQDTPHALGGGGEEMGTVGPLRLCVTAEAQPDFVDERGGLQGLAGRFVGQLGGGECAQLVVDERQQLRGRVRIVLPDPLEDEGDFAFVH